jgi:hypothetical protein
MRTLLLLFLAATWPACGANYTNSFTLQQGQVTNFAVTGVFQIVTYSVTSSLTNTASIVFIDAYDIYPAPSNVALKIRTA